MESFRNPDSYSVAAPCLHAFLFLDKNFSNSGAVAIVSPSNSYLYLSVSDSKSAATVLVISVISSFI